MLVGVAPGIPVVISSSAAKLIVSVEVSVSYSASASCRAPPKPAPLVPPLVRICVRENATSQPSELAPSAMVTTIAVDNVADRRVLEAQQQLLKARCAKAPAVARSHDHVLTEIDARRELRREARTELRVDVDPRAGDDRDDDRVRVDRRPLVLDEAGPSRPMPSAHQPRCIEHLHQLLDADRQQMIAERRIELHPDLAEVLARVLERVERVALPLILQQLLARESVRAAHPQLRLATRADGHARADGELLAELRAIEDRAARAAIDSFEPTLQIVDAQIDFDFQ